MTRSFCARTSFTTLLAAIALGGCGGGGDSDNADPGGTTAISVLSSKKDLVTAGDMVIDVPLPTGVTASQVKVLRNGADVTPSLVVTGSQALRGLVDGLVDGQNQIEAVVSSSGRKFATLTVRNSAVTVSAMTSCPNARAALDLPRRLAASATTRIKA